MNVHSARPLTDAIIYSLVGAGLAVGDAVRPEPQPAQGYVVVYGLVGGISDGPLGHPNDDAAITYMLISVGKDRHQCEWVADKARRTILAAALTIPDRKVILVAIDMLGGVQRDDDVQPPMFYSPDRYRIFSTPLVAA